MKPAVFFTLAVATATLAGCSSTKVTANSTGNLDFSSVKTYAWVQAPESILNEDDTLLDENLETALNNEFAARGWKPSATAKQSDIQVAYYIKLREQEEYAAPPTSGEPRVTGGFTYNQDNKSWDAKDQAPDLTIYTVEIGTLHLSIHDARTGKEVWSGTLQTKLDRSAPIEKRRLLYQKVAHKITGRIR